MRITFDGVFCVDGVLCVDNVEDWIGAEHKASGDHASISKFGRKYEFSVFDAEGTLVLTSDPIFASERAARNWLKIQFGVKLPIESKGENW